MTTPVVHKLETFYDDGALRTQEWKFNHLAHLDAYYRKGDPAYIEYYKDGESVSKMVWYEDDIRDREYMSNQIHRENDPAVIEYDRDGNVIKMMWYDLGELERPREPNKPSVIHSLGHYDEKLNTRGTTLKEWYYRNDLHSRQDEPSKVIYNGYGQVLREEWFHYGEHHRENGPAIFEPKHNSVGDIEEWYQYGKRHREDGPAHITYFKTGIIKVAEWYQNGVPYREDDEPVVETRWCNGEIRCRHWKDINNRLHRLTGPAQQETYAASSWRGRYHVEYWIKHGSLHRMDGPAMYEREDQKDIITKDRSFYIDGDFYELFDWLPLSTLSKADQVEYKIMLS